jgi:protein-tyrosine phosphatase
MFRIFKIFSQPKITQSIVNVDMHSHLIHGVDDGSKSLQESVDMIKNLVDLGYTHLITTPHIMSDFYKNTPEILLPKLDQIREQLVLKNIDCTIDVAAEYYIDNAFYENILQKKPLMTFGDKYILIETSYLNSPSNLFDVIFQLQMQSYKVIIAHPERYSYMFDDFNKYRQLFDKGVYFQININSLAGYYSPQSQKIAQKLISKNMVHFIGTDCHTPKHIVVLQKAMQTKAYRKLKNMELLNNSLA